MSENNLTKKAMQNVQGNKKLEKSILEYAKEIAIYLDQNPEILPELLIALEITKEELYTYLSTPEKGNITFYDQALCLVKTITKENKK